MTSAVAPHNSALRYAKHAMLEAIGLFAILKLATEVLIHRLPPGTPYILEPHGIGLLLDALAKTFLITFFLLLYTIPSFFARKWLGLILRALMFMLFVGFLTYLECTKYVAVVQTPTEFIFISLVHSDTIPNHQLPILSIKDTGAVRAIEIHGRDVMFKAAWHGDVAANQTLDALVAAMNAAR